jgi:hypothetical protein
MNVGQKMAASCLAALAAAWFAQETDSKRSKDSGRDGELLERILAIHAESRGHTVRRACRRSCGHRASASHVSVWLG